MNPTVDRIVGRNLRRLRENRGVSRHDLAAQASISADDLSGFEDDDVRVPAHLIYLLAVCLGVSISAFFDGFAVDESGGALVAPKLH